MEELLIQQIELQKRQISLLEELLSKQGKDLGFCSAPKARYIYANRKYPDCLWFFWRGDLNTHEPIQDNALRGRLLSISIDYENEYKGKPEPKLNVAIQADRKYIITCGHDTLFAKGLISSLATLSREQLIRSILIAVEPGDTDQVLFCRVYIGEDYIFAPYTPDTNWDQLVAKISANLPQQPQRADREAQTKQPNLISATRAPIEPETDLSDLVAQISVEIDRVGWSKKQGSLYLQETYGKKTRAELDNDQLVEFLSYLKDLPSRDLSTIPY